MHEFIHSSKFFRYNSFKFITPIECGYEACKPNHECNSVKKYWLLHYVVSGKGEYRVNDETYYPKPGQIFVIRPGEFVHYKSDEDEPWHYMWVSFKLDFKPPTVLEGDYCIDGTAYFSIMKKISAFADAEELDEVGCYAAIWELISLMDMNSQKKADGNYAYEAVKQAERFIELHYSRKISVAAIADMLHLDRSYFYVIFKRHTGLPPQQYINKYRLKMAAQYLGDGMSPGNTAAVCGYSDVYGFSKMFKKEYGVSPSAYAKRK